MTRWRYAAVNDAGRVVGADHHRAKLSDEDVALVHDLRAAGLSFGQIAAKFDDKMSVSKSMVRYICNGGRRAQTVMGHKRLHPRMPNFTPADLDEFDIAGGS